MRLTVEVSEIPNPLNVMIFFPLIFHMPKFKHLILDIAVMKFLERSFLFSFLDGLAFSVQER